MSEENAKTLIKQFYCQSQIEGERKCNSQCEHCGEYYKPLEEEQTKDELFNEKKL